VIIARSDSLMGVGASKLQVEEGRRNRLRGVRLELCSPSYGFFFNRRETLQIEESDKGNLC